MRRYILAAVDSHVDRLAPNLHRRFLRRDYRKRIFHASREIQRSARRQELEQERGHRLEANIASFREYRSGDFPDIEIPYSAIIKPMQQLAKVTVLPECLVLKSLLIFIISLKIINMQKRLLE
jgi:DNA-dependent protein kinase catalytic subunit